jgi:hypothetical protein
LGGQAESLSIIEEGFLHSIVVQVDRLKMVSKLEIMRSRRCPGSSQHKFDSCCLVVAFTAFALNVWFAFVMHTLSNLILWGALKICV